MSFHLSLRLLQLGDFPLATAKENQQTYHQMAKWQQWITLWMQKSKRASLLTNCSFSWACLHFFLLSIALHPEFPTAFSDNPCNLSWLSLICILNAHRCLFSEAFPPSAQNPIYPIEPPVSFTCTCFMQGRPSHPRLLRPWDPEILLPKYSYTLRILSEWDLIP